MRRSQPYRTAEISTLPHIEPTITCICGEKNPRRFFSLFKGSHGAPLRAVSIFLP